MSDVKNYSDFGNKKLSESIENGYKIENHLNDIKKPNRLSDTTIKELDERLADEYHAYFYYVNAHNWCKDKNFEKAAGFFKGEYENELIHARTMMDYMIDWNYKSSIEKPDTKYEFKDLVEILEGAYKIEYELLNSYNKSSNKIFLEGDIATFDFLCYFRKVQIDEVKEYSDFLNALQLIDPKDKFQLLYFEREYFGE